MDLIALPQDGARAKETDPSDYLRRDAGRVCCGAENFESKPREEAGADSDEAQGFDSRRVAMKLALETDCDGEDCGDEEAKRKVGVAC